MPTADALPPTPPTTPPPPPPLSPGIGSMTTGGSSMTGGSTGSVGSTGSGAGTHVSFRTTTYSLSPTIRDPAYVPSSAVSSTTAGWAGSATSSTVARTFGLPDG